MTIGLEDYGNTTKETWRGWWWNQIVAHLPEFHGKRVPAKGSAAMRAVTSKKTVLYLCGPDDFDRECALSRGFLSENVIAVDCDAKAVKGIRKRRGLAVRGRLEDVLLAWPKGWRIDVVSADLCCGLDRPVLRLVNAMVMSEEMCGVPVLAVNLQRGRDAVSNAFRSDAAQGMGRRLAVFAGWPPPPNRAAAFMVSVVELAARSATNKSYLVGDLVEQMNPAFLSYRGTRVLMDSVVTRWPLSIGWMIPKLPAIQRHSARAAVMSQVVNNREVISGKSEQSWNNRVLPALRRRIAALRAVRTMKQKQGA